MKLLNKSLLALAVTGMFSATAMAGPIEFDEGAAGGSGTIVIDGMDLSTSIGAVTQTDDGDGTVSGEDSFVELGDTIAVNWLLDGGIVGSDLANQGAGSGDYEVWLDYSLSGTAEGVPANFGTGIDIGVDFTSGMATLYLDNDVDGEFDMSGTLGSMTYINMADSIDCIVNGSVNDDGEVVVNTGGCDFNWDFSATAGFFSHGMDDLADMDPVTVNMDVTVETFDGLFFSYAAQEAYLAENQMDSDGDDVQQFGIEHDANISFIVPEPGSLATLGLGLLALAGFRRKQ